MDAKTTDERTNGRADKRTDGHTDEQTDGQTNKWTDERTNSYVSARDREHLFYYYSVIRVPSINCILHKLTLVLVTLSFI